LRSHAFSKVKPNFETDMKHQTRRLPKILGQPGGELAPTNQDWQKAVTGRKAVADDGVNNGKPHGKCLQESLQLQKQLRQLTHQVLVAQEDEREKISRELRDEIAQTLLGINVRLLLLKQAARSKAKGLKSEIASAQRLVVKSASLVRRLARELDNHRLTPGELAVTAI
jgi:signal transduction histidine kinase